ncbi:MAG: aminopeptidase P family protein, partial [Muribaculaceae bacterium]|nr:aminopeptidase P family protein [Muribaculaceae bacterium]
RDDGLRHCAVYSRIDSCYREGMTDLEFQIEIEHVLRMEGCLGFLRVAGSRMEINMGSLLAGPNADVPSPYDFSMGGAGVDPSLPVGASGIIMKPGMSVMVDMNGGFNGYQTDMTRCWTVGEVGEKALRAHECSRAILRDLESFARPGVEAGELYRRAARIAEEAGLSSCFMGHAHKVAFIGHGVGIELNEAPVLMGRDRTLLEENMTLAIEPKFVIPEVGALGVENTYVVTDGGLENLTPFNENLAAL